MKADMFVLCHAARFVGGLQHHRPGSLQGWGLYPGCFRQCPEPMIQGGCDGDTMGDKTNGNINMYALTHTHTYIYNNNINGNKLADCPIMRF